MCSPVGGAQDFSFTGARSPHLELARPTGFGEGKVASAHSLLEVRGEGGVGEGGLALGFISTCNTLSLSLSRFPHTRTTSTHTIITVKAACAGKVDSLAKFFDSRLLQLPPLSRFW